MLTVLVLLSACLGPCTRGLNRAASYLAPRPLLGPPAPNAQLLALLPLHCTAGRRSPPLAESSAAASCCAPQRARAALGPSALAAAAPAQLALAC